MTPTSPEVSVVIPTRNRRELLRNTMQGLIAQDFGCDRFEVVVIDNHSTDGTEAMLREFDGGRRRIVYVLGEDRGPAPARNLGAAQARGEILAFTDSDCRPAE